VSATSVSLDRLRRIGVIGAGQMGGGIAHVCALAGIDVAVTDINDEALQRGRQAIERNLSRQVARGTIREEDKDAALARIRMGLDYALFADCGMVIEAATENEEIKREIFKKLTPTLKPDALIATNTSSISITRLAASTDRPAKFMGMHFMNPVPLMVLVEVIRAAQTSDASMAIAFDLCKALGKIAVESADRPGFIANRVLMPMINEAIYAVDERVGTPEAIDQVMKLGMNHPMGPLTLADFIGLDVCLAILRVLRDGFGDAKYTPCPLLERLVAAGKLGRKSGEGFYKY
jgi:3-hydroxybutyryl-CoA dehydrogenase